MFDQFTETNPRGQQEDADLKVDRALVNNAEYNRQIIREVVREVFEGQEPGRVMGWDIFRVTITNGTEQTFNFDRDVPLILVQNIDGYTIDFCLGQSFMLSKSFIYTKDTFLPVRNHGRALSVRNNSGTDCEIAYVLAG